MQDSTSQDILVTLDEPVLTNYLLVKGDYKNLTLCLEANEPELATVQKHP